MRLHPAIPGAKLATAGALACVLLSLGCNPASEAFREGRKAEARKDYDSALIDFDKALQSDPENPHYLLWKQEAGTQAAIMHVRRGEKLLSENRPAMAAGEFQKAVSIDPTNQRAEQQLLEIMRSQASEKEARANALRQALKPLRQAVGPMMTLLKPLPTEPLAHFKISADSRQVFETLAKLAGLNVAFSWDFQPRPISLDLTDVKLEDALRAAAYESHVFWKAITPNTILILPDNPQNRRQYEDQVLRTVYLENWLAPADRTQITTTLKQTLQLAYVVENPNSNSIIIRDAPEKVAEAEDLIRSLDLGKAEILINVTILEADRDRLRTLGLIPATNLSLIPTPPTSATPTIPSVPLNHINLTKDYSLVLPSAVATALLNDTHTHILQSPQVRATDGMTAKLRIGSRVPYATGSFLPSFAGTTGTTGGVGLLASTQFQYQDIGVNLDITPHVTSTGEISMHAKIEISSRGADTQVAGISEPTFNQRIVEHDIQLLEGEVSLLGGLTESQTVRTVEGLPGLGDIPLLRYLFSSEMKETTDTEVLILLSPHIIRLPEMPTVSAKVVSGTSTSEGGPQ